MKSRPSLTHSEKCKIRMMVEMENDENTHRVRKWSVEKGIDEGEVSFKHHDEGKASNTRNARKNKSLKEPTQTCTCPTPAAATRQCEELRRDTMTSKAVKKATGPRQAVTTATRCAAQ